MTRYDSHKLQCFKSSSEPSADSSTCETSRSLRSSSNALRSSSNAKNFTGKCFFCNQTAEDDVLHQCKTLYMDVRVRKVAHELGDTKLLAKLTEWYLVAVEAVYHPNCLKKLYNRYRSHKNWSSSDRYNLEMIKVSSWGKAMEASRHKNKLAFLPLLLQAVKYFNTKLTSYKCYYTFIYSRYQHAQTLWL